MTMFGYWFYTPSLLLMYQQELGPVSQKSRNFSGPENSRDFRETAPCLRKQWHVSFDDRKMKIYK